MKVLSTYKILKSKAFNENIDESWIDWAIEMIESGYESENLFILAGEMKPYNQFELQELTTKVLQDLELDFSDKVLVTNNYVYYLIATAFDKPEIYYETLRILTDICRELDYDSRYMDFYFLYFAKSDLAVDEVQYYWDGANRGNIDLIIKDKFEKWIREYEQLIK